MQDAPEEETPGEQGNAAQQGDTEEAVIVEEEGWCNVYAIWQVQDCTSGTVGDAWLDFSQENNDILEKTSLEDVEETVTLSEKPGTSFTTTYSINVPSRTAIMTAQPNTIVHDVKVRRCLMEKTEPQFSQT